MADDIATTTGIARHGATRLPSVDLDSFNLELKDEEGFLGDRASKGAFRKILDRWRKPLRKSGEDRLGESPPTRSARRSWTRCSSTTTPRHPPWCTARSRSSRRSSL